MSTREEPLKQTAGLYEETAKELDSAAAHCRRAAEHFTNENVPRGTAHAWAARGHVLEAQELLDRQARQHAERSRP